MLMIPKLILPRNVFVYILFDVWEWCIFAELVTGWWLFQNRGGVRRQGGAVGDLGQNQKALIRLLLMRGADLY